MEVKLVSQGRQNSIDGSSISEVNAADAQTNTLNSDDTSVKVRQSNSKNKYVTVKEAQKVADKVNKLLEDKHTHIELEQDKNFKYVMVMKVIDDNTNKVINQIPSKQILDMVAQFCQIAGLVLDRKV